jgi:acyl-CoA thioester hydrolase
MPAMPFAMLSLRVDPSDLDAYGYVNAIAIVKYLQASRIQYWEEVGIQTFQQEQKVGPLVVSCTIDAVTPLFYPGQVHVRSRMLLIGNSSFSMRHEISNGDGKVAVTAEETMVMFDYSKKEKCPFPDFVRERVQELEGEHYPV